MTDTRFPTGWTELDRLIGELGPKRFAVVAGVPSAGMTTTLLSLIDSAAVMGNVPTLFVDLENGLPIITDRLLACVGVVDYRRIRDGLAALYPDMQTAAFAEVLQEALAAAQLAGRFEVTQET